MRYQMDSVLSGIGIKGHCVDAKQHRHFAFYDIKLEHSSSVRKLRNRVEDIALGIKSKTNPIVKSIPEKGVVRLQVATKDAEVLSFDEMYKKECCLHFGSPKIPDMTLPFLIGEDHEGNPVWMDFKNNPHLLIAGGTGSGKSVLLHNLISNILMLHSLDVREAVVYLVDPKRVEFGEYKNQGLRSVIGGVFHDYAQTVNLLNYLINLMEARYKYMETIGVKSIEEYPRLFPSVMVIIDEVSDLLMQDKGAGVLQDCLITLAQKARAAGIYLVLATQRPSVDVITGLIKANFPGRIACKTASGTDSKVILDMPGAESLLGRGDALLRNMVHDLIRFQVAYSEPSKTIFNFNEYYGKYRNNNKD